MPLEVRDARADDVAAITRIQNALLASTTIEWTDRPYSAESRRSWIEAHRVAGHPVLVAEVDGEVVGVAAYGHFRDTQRWPGYGLTVEHTVHVDGRQWGRGVGRALVDELCARASDAGVHAIVAAIDGDNVGSIRFHERLGFAHVGRLPEVGHGHGRWLDLVLMQRLLPGSPPVA
jgi:L-amino acid N-acyltransferase